MEKENIRVRNLRKKMGILPSVKRINTIASEHPELTNYLYLTYDGSSHDITYYPNEKNVIILGSGALSNRFVRRIRLVFGQCSTDSTQIRV